VLLKLCDSRTIDGLLILGPCQKAMCRVDAALSLIQLHDPVRYRRLTQDLKRIWVRRLVGCLGQFDQSSWTCALDSRFVQDGETTAEMIAATIVHEATHARLHRRGIGYDEDRRLDVEEVCLRREMAFSAKLPDGALVREQAERTLHALPDMDLSSAGHRDRLREWVERTLRDVGMPKWIVRLIIIHGDWLHRRKLARMKHRTAAE
jgi:hypothetical protein